MTTTLLMPRLPLRARLTLVTALLSGLALIIFGLGFYRTLESALLRDVDERLAVAAYQLSVDSLAALPDHIVTPGIVAKLITPDERSYVLSARPPVVTIPDEPALTAAARAGRTASGTVQLRPGERMRLLAMPVGSG